MCRRQLRSKALREVRNIAPMGKYELAHLCLRLGQSKALRRNGGIAPMCLRPWWRKALREVWDIAPMGQWILGSKIMKEGWLPMHKNGRHLKYTSTSQQVGCKQKRSIIIVAPHHTKVNVGVVLIHQYYQQIIMFHVGVNNRRKTWVIDGQSPCIKDADHA